MRLHLSSALAHKHVLFIQLWMIHETAAAQQSPVRLISIQNVSSEILFNTFYLTNSFISIQIRVNVLKAWHDVILI